MNPNRHYIKYDDTHSWCIVCWEHVRRLKDHRESKKHRNRLKACEDCSRPFRIEPGVKKVRTRRKLAHVKQRSEGEANEDDEKTVSGWGGSVLRKRSPGSPAVDQPCVKARVSSGVVDCDPSSDGFMPHQMPPIASPGGDTPAGVQSMDLRVHRIPSSAVDTHHEMSKSFLLENQHPSLY